jgi:GNAT superfamily N-acetyltransferase
MTTPKIDIERPSALDDASARALDAILADARNHLVPSDAWLEPAADRVGEAEVDEERWIYVARVNGEPAGLLDAQLGSPEPGVVTIVHVAVARPHRGHGVGRALVEALVRDASEGGCALVRACVLDRQSEGFWPELDFERVGEEYRRGL